jgi:hypothetical protein
MIGKALFALLQFARFSLARQRQRLTKQRTQREMNLLPKHLLEDVNALGLPLDPALTRRACQGLANSSRNFIGSMTPIPLIDG